MTEQYVSFVSVCLTKWKIALSAVPCASYIEALVDAVMKYFHITKAQLEEFTFSFVHRLPKYMREALERRETAA